MFCNRMFYKCESAMFLCLHVLIIRVNVIIFYVVVCRVIFIGNCVTSHFKLLG